MTTRRETQKEWFERVADGRSMRSVASAIGMGSGNLSTYLNAEKLSAEKIIAIAVELGVDPVQALLDNQILPDGSKYEKPNKAEIIAQIDRLMNILKEEIDEGAEIIPLNPRLNNTESDSMFENMVADSSPDEDHLRNGDEEHD